jgi:hypothetical protein
MNNKDLFSKISSNSVYRIPKGIELIKTSEAHVKLPYDMIGITHNTDYNLCEVTLLDESGKMIDDVYIPKSLSNQIERIDQPLCFPYKVGDTIEICGEIPLQSMDWKRRLYLDTGTKLTVFWGGFSTFKVHYVDEEFYLGRGTNVEEYHKLRNLYFNC